MAPRLIGTAVAFAVLSSPVLAQTTCFDRERMIKTLHDGYSEKVVGQGLRNQTSLFEVFRSENGATWTIVQTFPNGMSCVIAAGEAWLDTSEEAFAPVELDG